MLCQQAVLVAHGMPSDPVPQDEVMQRLAMDVATLAPGWDVRGATLARPGSLERALEGTVAAAIYPFFMAEGFFTGQMLPARLGEISAQLHQMPPFGTEAALPALMADVALKGAAAASYDPQDTTLFLAAHGSKVSRSSKVSAMDMVRRLQDMTRFRRVTLGFVEEQPFLADAARDLGQAICLPFFALRAGHVEDDIPQALATAGFTGPLLPAIGEHVAVPRLIANSLLRLRHKAAA